MTGQGEPVLRSVSATLKPGQALQVFGANGAGKSSLLNVIAGLTPLAEGNLSWHFDNESGSGRPPAEAIVFVGHDNGVKPALTVKENLAFWAQLYGATKDAVAEAITMIGLDGQKDMPVRRCSAGQKRRLDLARCQIAQRPIWLLDEPTAALDKAGSALAANLVTSHLDKGGIAIIASHDRLDITSQDVQLG